MVALLGTALLLSGCASGGSGGGGADYSGNRALTSSADIRSPASERVVDGVVEMVLGDQLLSSFDEAARRPIKAVRDGQPLYAYLRANRPLGELAHPADPYGRMAFSAYPHLFIQIGDTQSLRIINTCYVTLTPAEARATDLVVPLAPLTNRVGELPSDCWLETVTRADPVRQTFEVRLAGFPGKFESWLPVPDLLAVQPVEIDLSKGVNAYGAMLRAEPVKAPVLASRAPAAGARGNASASAAHSGGALSEQGRAARELAPADDGTGAARAARRAEAGSAAAGQSAAGAGGASVTAPAGAAATTAAAAASVTAGAASGAASAVSGRAREASAPEARVDGRNAIVSIADRRGEGREVEATVRETREDRTASPSTSAGAQAAASPASRIASLPAGARLTALTPLLPAARQSVGTNRMATQLQSMTSTLLGREPSETYFIDRRWQARQERGQRSAQQVMRAVAIFKGEECSWQSLLVSRKPGAGTLSDVAADGDEVVIPCPFLRPEN